MQAYVPRWLHHEIIYEGNWLCLTCLTEKKQLPLQQSAAACTNNWKWSEVLLHHLEASNCLPRCWNRFSSSTSSYSHPVSLCALASLHVFPTQQSCCYDITVTVNTVCECDWLSTTFFQSSSICSSSTSLLKVVTPNPALLKQFAIEPEFTELHITPTKWWVCIKLNFSSYCLSNVAIVLCVSAFLCFAFTQLMMPNSQGYSILVQLMGRKRTLTFLITHLLDEQNIYPQIVCPSSQQIPSLCHTL
jgi:hypothetical protein